MLAELKDKDIVLSDFDGTLRAEGVRYAIGAAIAHKLGLGHSAKRFLTSLCRGHSVMHSLHRVVAKSLQGQSEASVRTFFAEVIDMIDPTHLLFPGATTLIQATLDQGMPFVICSASCEWEIVAVLRKTGIDSDQIAIIATTYDQQTGAVDLCYTATQKENRLQQALPSNTHVVMGLGDRDKDGPIFKRVHPHGLRIGVNEHGSLLEYINAQGWQLVDEKQFAAAEPTTRVLHTDHSLEEVLRVGGDDLRGNFGLHT